MQHLSALGYNKVQMWKINIHNMLQRIPEELKDEEEDDDNDDDNEEEDNIGDKFFYDIKSQLANYEHLQYGLMVLELALWKEIITEHSNGNISPE